jgi:hypothetical protein
MARVRYTSEEAKKLKSGTDWEKIKSLTEQEIHEAALADPDAQPLTEEELKQFKRVVHRGGGVYGHDKGESSKQAPSKQAKGAN